MTEETPNPLAELVRVTSGTKHVATVWTGELRLTIETENGARITGKIDVGRREDFIMVSALKDRRLELGGGAWTEWTDLLEGHIALIGRFVPGEDGNLYTAEIKDQE